MEKIDDFDKIMSDRKLFNNTVYTPLSKAIKILEERRQDKKLMEKVRKLLKGNIPKVLINKKCGVLCRQIATPNHETKMFLSITKDNNLFPLLFEYHDDRFVPENEFKHSLGQLHLQKKKDRKGYAQVERITIVDFTKNSGKKLKNIKTLWEEPLIDFHKKLFYFHGYESKDFDFYDGSSWYKENGEKAINYYTNFFLLFTCFGILFENFLISKDAEGEFTRDIVLPAIKEVFELTGIKPLIIPVGPLDVENDSLWYYHDYKIKDILIKNKNQHGKHH